uniref:Copine domain-containing protein n=2 Tax=Caenorhabditis tropicalis TaxID=1561998 RepID=A0A1I7UIL1_9PELO
MNMVRIRHIMEMRRACKAPPLLPPKLRKEGSESSDRRGVKDVMDLTFRVNTLAPERFPSSSYYLHLYESQDSSEGPWTLITESDRLGTGDVAALEDFLAIEFSFERLQWFKMEISEPSETGVKVIKSSEIFTIAQICAGPISFPMVDQSGYRIAEIEIWSQLRDRPQPIVMQMEAKNLSTKLVSSNASVYIEVYRVEDGQKRMLYRSETAKQTKLTWRPFTVQSDDLYGTDGFESQIEIVCISEEEKEGIIGQALVSMDVAKAQEPIPIYNETYKQGRKPIGEVRMCRYQQLRVCSFLDYIRGGTSMKFAVAIDFSVKEPLTPNDYQQYSNDIEFVVRCLGETLEPFNPNNSWLSYGFGAKIPPQYRDSNNFCLSLDADATCQGVNGVLNAFGKSHQHVHPLPGAKFSQIIYHVAKQAQNNFNRASEPPSYFVLFVITRGCIEDLKETVQAAIFASKAPVSIVFVGIGCEGLDEIERMGNAGKRLEFQGRKSERDNLQFVNATKTRLECDNYSDMATAFLEKALQQIPWQCSTFYMQNHVLPGKSSEDGGSSGGLMAPSSSRRPSSAQGEEEELRMRTSSSGEQTRSRRHRLSNEMRSMTLDDSR